MEVCVPCNTSACPDVSSSYGSSTDPDCLIDYDSGDLSVDELETCLTKLLNIEGITISTDLDRSPKKNSIEYAASPPHDGPKLSGDVSGEKEEHEEGMTTEVSEVNGYGSGEPSNQCHPRSVSLPTPLKPVSAMKGTREKQGMPPKNRSVSWAPDVYDPIPTSTSHVPSNKNQHHRRDGKRSGRYKQKGSSGKSSRGSSSRGKDKKQARKSGGHSSGKLRPFLEDSGVVSFGEFQLRAVDFDVESPDQLCGTSFLKKSLTKLHYPFAEAT